MFKKRTIFQLWEEKNTYREVTEKYTLVLLM